MFRIIRRFNKPLSFSSGIERLFLPDAFRFSAPDIDFGWGLEEFSGDGAGEGDPLPLDMGDDSDAAAIVDEGLWTKRWTSD